MEEEALILETTFVIDLERERHAARRIAATRSAGRRSVRAQPAGPAHQLLEARPDQPLSITITTAGELAAGVGAEERARWEAFLRPFDVLGIDLDACWQYSRAYRYLAQHGMLIGTNDLWIAAIALAHELPLVTRNRRHFERVPGLRVIGYADES